MYVGRDFDNMEPAETDVFSLEFTDDLKNGRTISAPTFQCTVLKTDPGATPDPNPSQRIDGDATITTGTFPVTGVLRTFANQKITGMVAGNLYSIQATVQTSDSCTLQRYSRCYCTAVR